MTGGYGNAAARLLWAKKPVRRSKLYLWIAPEDPLVQGADGEVCAGSAIAVRTAFSPLRRLRRHLPSSKH